MIAIPPTMAAIAMAMKMSPIGGVYPRVSVARGPTPGFGHTLDTFLGGMKRPNQRRAHVREAAKTKGSA